MAAMAKGRIAEVVATHPGGRRRGSGYRIKETVVLTAAHVIENPTCITVRFNPDLPDEREVDARVLLVDRPSDLAFLEIIGPGDALPGGDEPVRFGTIGNRDAVLPARAFGFPRWKLRSRAGGAEKARYRDLAHAHGSIASFSHLREGTLEFLVAAAPPATPVWTAPWEGMSGAAVWVDDLIVGIVSRSYESDGTDKLTIARIDHYLRAADDAGDGATQSTLAQLAQSTEMASVAFPTAQDVLASAHRSEVETIAPRELRGREKELARLTRFCGRSVGEQYTWWQAGPWSGKTALASWFALNSPIGIDVVSFFVTSRFAGHADSPAFLESVIAQLAVIVGEKPRESYSARASFSAYTRLLFVAASQLERNGRRLVLLVDGLDEDRSHTQPNVPSIASQLPALLPANVRVIVTSRYSPKLPIDVPDDHPLHSVELVDLVPSEYARSIRSLALNELSIQARENSLHQDLIGFISAAGGGLSLADLHELIRTPTFAIEHALRGPLGRTISERSPTFGNNEHRESVFLFAHETLRDLAEAHFGQSLHAYRERLHVWADSYESQGWPSETPTYLLRGYFRMVSSVGDFDRMVSLATDIRRHTALARTSGGDGLALVEVQASISAIGKAEEILTHLPSVELSIVLKDLVERNSRIPAALPAAYALAGQPALAATLASGISDAVERTRALLAVMQAVTDTGAAVSLELALSCREAVRQIRDPARRGEASAALAPILASQGAVQDAEAIISSISGHLLKIRTIADVILTLARRGSDATTVRKFFSMARSALDILDGPSADLGRMWLASAALMAGEGDMADRLITLIREQSRAIEAIRQIAVHVSMDQALTVVARLSDTAVRAMALASLVEIAAPDRELATRLVDEAHACAVQVRHPYTRAQINIELESAIVSDQQFDNAESQLARLPDWSRDERLVRLSAMAAVYGLGDRAERLVTRIRDGGKRHKAEVHLVRTLAARGDMARAEDFIYSVQGDLGRAKLLGQLIVESVKLGRPPAPALLVKAADIAEAISSSSWSAPTLADLAVAVATVGDGFRAEHIAGLSERAARVTATVNTRRDAMRTIAAALLSLGRADDARRLVGANPVESERLVDRTGLLHYLVTQGRYESAIAVCREMSDSADRSRWMAEIAVLVAAQGRFTDAHAATVELKFADLAMAMSTAGMIAADRADVSSSIAFLLRIPDAEESVRHLISLGRSTEVINYDAVLAAIDSRVRENTENSIAINRMVTCWAIERLAHVDSMDEATWLALSQRNGDARDDCVAYTCEASAMGRSVQPEVIEFARLVRSYTKRASVLQRIVQRSDQLPDETFQAIIGEVKWMLHSAGNSDLERNVLQETLTFMTKVKAERSVAIGANSTKRTSDTSSWLNAYLGRPLVRGDGNLRAQEIAIRFASFDDAAWCAAVRSRSREDLLPSRNEQAVVLRTAATRDRRFALNTNLMAVCASDAAADLAAAVVASARPSKAWNVLAALSICFAWVGETDMAADVGEAIEPADIRLRACGRALGLASRFGPDNSAARLSEMAILAAESISMRPDRTAAMVDLLMSISVARRTSERDRLNRCMPDWPRLLRSIVLEDWMSSISPLAALEMATIVELGEWMIETQTSL